MPLYRYVKTYPRRRVRKPIVLSYIFIAVGFGVLAWTIWPIASFYLYDRIMYAKTVSPVGEAVGKVVAPIAYAATETTNNPNTWFPTSPQKKVVAPVNSYQLSIPSLSLVNATVIIAGDDLEKSLIHYGGTGIPGEYGNTVIFGHSTLPQLFQGARDYHAVFATLPTIKLGSDIFITYDGVEYRYRVFDKVVVDPTDLTPLEQRFDDSYLTLVTCVPPGTYLYRLNVKAKLVRI